MITSLSQDMANYNKRAALQDYEIVYSKLNQFIEKVNQKIVSRIQLVQQVYLDDYKQQVSIMATELKNIRGVLDEQMLKQRSNQRLFYLQQERDFFRAQVIKLNEDLKKSGQQNQKLKAQLQQSKSQCANFKKIVYDLETRIYKLTYQNIQIQKMKQQAKNMAATTLNSTLSPKKGFVSQRQNQSLKDYQNQSEVQPRLQKQKTQYSLRKLKPSHSLAATASNLQVGTKYSEPNSREQILDRCIKQVKKQIFYRNLNVKQSAKINFSQQDKVSFDKFTKSDKRQLVSKFMSNPQILQDFYKYVFQKQYTNGFKQSTKNVALQKIALSKGIDSRYNTRMLENFKAQFDKRIYDIKANRY